MSSSLVCTLSVELPPLKTMPVMTSVEPMLMDSSVRIVVTGPLTPFGVLAVPKETPASARVTVSAPMRSVAPMLALKATEPVPAVSVRSFAVALSIGDVEKNTMLPASVLPVVTVES